MWIMLERAVGECAIEPNNRVSIGPCLLQAGMAALTCLFRYCCWLGLRCVRVVDNVDGVRGSMAGITLVDSVIVIGMRTSVVGEAEKTVRRDVSPVVAARIRGLRPRWRPTALRTASVLDRS